MGSARVWAQLLGLVKVVMEGVEFDEDEPAVVVSVRPRKATKRRCGVCGKRCPGYDQGHGRRRCRALDLGTIQAFLEADSPRVSCAEHGVVAAQVPWARHGALGTPTLSITPPTDLSALCDPHGTRRHLLPRRNATAGTGRVQESYGVQIRSTGMTNRLSVPA